MSDKKKSKNTNRVYTLDEVERLLNNSAEAMRERRLQLLQKLFRMVLSFYAGLAAVVSVIIGLYGVYHHDPTDEKDVVLEPYPVVISAQYSQNGGVKDVIYDATDFSLGVEESVITGMLADVSVSLTDIDIPKELAENVFATHCQNFKAVNDLSFLRFRVKLKRGRIVEAAVPACGMRIFFTRGGTNRIIPMNEILCFRGALSGPTYREEIVRRLNIAGISEVPKNCVAGSSEECLSDVEAQRLFSELAMEAMKTQFDWCNVLRIVTFGVWNRYHPWWSIIVTIIVAVVVLLLARFGMSWPFKI